ncbi:MAG: efflux RND transporter periplasmic adaptor subunit [Demequinaceae bacterium]|nr:efflux RND transporter periplasmic adaptor subunit [Demequinaceae bacterium]
MTWTNRFKFSVGLIAVFAIVGAATLVFNQRQLRVESETATIAASTVQVVTDYPGFITDALVKKGDQVTVGDPLFTLQSLQLQRDAAAGVISNTRAGASSDGVLTVFAAADGVVSDVLVEVGEYSDPGAALADVDESGTLFVEAEFKLTPLDFGRIEDGAIVEYTLPNQQVLTGSVSTLKVETVDGEAVATIHVDTAGLVWGDEQGLIQPGTPVEATLYLRDDGPLAGVSDRLKSFLHKVGL